MNVYAKTILEENELVAKLKYKDMIDGIELHLTSDFKFDKDKQSLVQKYPNVIKNIHLPTYKNKNDMYGIKELFFYNNESVLAKCFSMAEFCSQYNNNNTITLIIHNNLQFEDIIEQRRGKTELHIINCLKKLFEVFPHVNIAIENTMPLFPDKGSFSTRNGFLFENVQIVNELKKQLPEHAYRIGTCLDICHAKGTIFTINKIYQGTNVEVDIPTLDDYFEQNARVCSCIHFNNAKGLGEGENHGIAFTEDEINEVLNYYKKYNYTAPLVIEQSEIDYLNPQNLPFTLNQLKSRGLLNH